MINGEGLLAANSDIIALLTFGTGCFAVCPISTICKLEPRIQQYERLGFEQLPAMNVWGIRGRSGSIICADGSRMRSMTCTIPYFV